jgi:acetyl esterase
LRGQLYHYDKLDSTGLHKQICSFVSQKGRMIVSRGPSPAGGGQGERSQSAAIDPDLLVILEALNTTGFKPLHELSVDDARALSEQRAEADSGPKVARVTDMYISTTNADIPIRIYYPEGIGPWPCVIYFHGGGWVVGSIETSDAFARRLALATGSAVVSVGYRLAPEHPFPAAVDDALAVANWIWTNPATVNADGSALTVCGDSAGGNLAAVTALRARDEAGPPIGSQVLIYPATDHNLDRASYQRGIRGLLQRADMEWFWSHYLSEVSTRAHPHASPLRAPTLAGLPPAMVVTAEFDPLCDEGEAYAAALGAAGVSSTLVRCYGLGHGFLRMPSVNRSYIVLDMIAGFIRRVRTPPEPRIQDQSV